MPERLDELWPLLLLAIAAWELLRLFVFVAGRGLLRRSTQRFVERHRVKVDPFKFVGRWMVREELLADLELEQAIVDAARTSGRPYAQLREQVAGYIQEMVPRFSLTTYFQLGLSLARLAVRIPYVPAVDRGSAQRLETIPREAVQVYVFNHRSNYDYVLAGVALARRICLSWAVGEWARVWPLDRLFKAFGAFFLRRRSGDPLYRTVLRRYVQLITRHGVTQGFFPEGRLTRDGALGEARAGLLDYIVSSKADPRFGRDIVFVPVGLQFDRVFEDETLIGEAAGRDRPPGFLQKALSAAVVAGGLPVALFTQLARLMTGRLMGRYGMAAVAYGEPLSLDAWMREKCPELPALPKETRQARVSELVAELMRRIGAAVPVTPVPFAARALVEAGALDAEVPLADVTAAAAKLRRELAARHAPLLLGKDFARLEDLKHESGGGRAEMRELSDEIVDLEQAEGALEEALLHLRRRRAVKVAGGRTRVLKRELVLYYARSLPLLAPPQGSAAAAPSPQRQVG